MVPWCFAALHYVAVSFTLQDFKLGIALVSSGQVISSDQQRNENTSAIVGGAHQTQMPPNHPVVWD